MTRLNDRLLIQKVDDDVVVIDESTGSEVVVPAPRVIQFTLGISSLVARGERGERNGRVDVSPTLLAEVAHDGEALRLSDLGTGDEVLIPSEVWSTLGEALDYFTSGVTR